jgi:hypothetical protein
MARAGSTATLDIRWPSSDAKCRACDKKCRTAQAECNRLELSHAVVTPSLAGLLDLGHHSSAARA